MIDTLSLSLSLSLGERVKSSQAVPGDEVVAWVGSITNVKRSGFKWAKLQERKAKASEKGYKCVSSLVKRCNWQLAN